MSTTLSPGVWNLESFGLVDRMFFENVQGALGCAGGSYGIDNVIADLQPAVGEYNLELGTWTDENGSPLQPDNSNYTNGGSSLLIPKAGYSLLRAPTLDTGTLDALGSRVSLDVYIPSEQSNPSWVGDAQLFVSIPSASISNQPLGYQSLTALPRDAWSQIDFDLGDTVLHTLRQRHPDVQFDLAVTLSSNTAPTRIDYLRFTGNIEPTQRCGDGEVAVNEECDDGNQDDGDGCSATCLSEGAGSICNENEAIDLGSVNQVSSIAADACLKVTDYPGSWATDIELQSQNNGNGYPLTFVWENCVGSGSGEFIGDWHQQSLNPVSPDCPTLIHLMGSTGQEFSLSWWGNGG